MLYQDSFITFLESLRTSNNSYIINIILEGYNVLIEATEDESYKGEHEAPDKHHIPLINLTTNGYPEDIYSHDAPRLYGINGGDNMDRQSISIMQSARNRPNKPITVYRASPDINKEIKEKIKNISNQAAYLRTHRFLPMGSEFQEMLHKLNWNGEALIEKLYEKIDELKINLKPDIKINPGDWVTINRDYAKEHGRDNLNNKYKIISKTVKASDLFTFGDSIHEWGYDP